MGQPASQRTRAEATWTKSNGNFNRRRFKRDNEQMGAPRPIDEKPRGDSPATPIASASGRSKGRPNSPSNTSLPPYIGDLYRTRLLTREEEKQLFRRLAEGTSELNRRSQDFDGDDARLERLQREQAEIRNRIAEANLRLVVAIAKRFVGVGQPEFYELVAEGNVILLKAIDQFDVDYGTRFSTYVTTAIRRHLMRLCTVEQRRRQRFASNGDSMELSVEERTPQPSEFLYDPQLDQKVRRLLRGLDDRERLVVQARFGFDDRKRRSSYRELGEQLGVSKERVRQLHERAMQKMRVAAQTSLVDSSAA